MTLPLSYSRPLKAESLVTLGISPADSRCAHARKRLKLLPPMPSLRDSNLLITPDPDAAYALG